MASSIASRPFCPAGTSRGSRLSSRRHGPRLAPRAASEDAGKDLLDQLKHLKVDLPEAAPAESSSSGGCGGGCSSGSHLSDAEKEARMLTSGLIEKMNELLPTTLTREDMRAAFEAGGQAGDSSAGERFWTMAEVVASSADDPDADLDELVV
eukprot:scaffold5.g650.t1